MLGQRFGQCSARKHFDETNRGYALERVGRLGAGRCFAEIVEQREQAFGRDVADHAGVAPIVVADRLLEAERLQNGAGLIVQHLLKPVL